MKLTNIKKLMALLSALMVLMGMAALPVAAGANDGFNDTELFWPCEKHEYDNSCDTRCNNCLFEREITHTYDDKTDVCCNVCGEYRIVITSEPKAGNYVKEGETIKVAVKAYGDGLKYAWYIKNAGGTKYSKSSVTSATYSVKMSDKVHGRRVYCVITDAHGNKLQASTAILRRQASIITEPATAAYAQMGKNVSVKIAALGDELTYTWYVKNAGASEYTKSSITTNKYSTKMSDKVKGRRVYCVVKDKYGKTVQSKTFLLREAVSLVEEPATTVYAKKNYAAKVTINATGDGLKYAWYVKDTGASEYTKSSVTSSTYSATMTTARNGRQLYCVVTDKYGNQVTTAVVTLKMK